MWLAIGLLTLPTFAADDFVWLEAEKPAYANLKPNIAGWGRPEFLSASNWLHISIEANKVDQELPAEGGLLRYEFSLAQTGQYQIWNRIGFEAVRSPFDWRLDAGAWQRVRPEELTTDLMELSFWTEVAWLKMGDQELAAGPHKLEIRLPRTLPEPGNEKGKPNRILYASDALVIYRGAFHPGSKFKPDQVELSAKDREAAQQVFRFPAASSPESRISLKLNGLWEVTRHDEQMPGEVAAPIQDFPAQPHWSAIPVPSNKNESRPDLIFAHRLWYRTRVLVPESLAGRSFFLVFPQNNLNTTVYVNGQYCGFDKNPFARVQIDVTRGLRTGTNELWVGIKDAWYGFSTSPTDPLKLRKKFNLPVKYFGDGFQDLAYPIWNHPQSGILVTPELVAAGTVYISDVFVKPSVTQQQLSLDLAIKNPTDRKVLAQVACEVVDPASGQTVMAFDERALPMEPRQEMTLNWAKRWENPRLWWPDDPFRYLLRTKVRIETAAGRKAVPEEGASFKTQPDLQSILFGFREWSWDGPQFKLNGLPWHGWADCFTAPDPESWLKFYRQSSQRMMRFWGTKWQGLPPEEALDFFDRNGVVVRRSGILDGEAIGYLAIENDPELQKLLGSKIKVQLMTNWIDQMVAQVKGERNHPSVNIWSLENEWLYINCINLYGGQMDEFETWVKQASEAVRTADPTRPTMTDGGGANRDQALPVHGNHYVFESGTPEKYPALAYDENLTGGGRGRWAWDRKRPRFIGEDFFATGINPFDYAYFGGEAAFQGKTEATPAAGIVYRMLTEGYRWADYAAWHFWLGQDNAKNQYGANAPRAAFVREWDWTFGEDQRVTRTIGLFNDTRFADPMQFSWALTVNGKKVAGRTTEHRVPPGENVKFDLTLDLPKVAVRQAGELGLTLAVKGQEVFWDSKAVSILNTSRKNPSGVAGLKAKDLLVFDPKGTVTGFLNQRRIEYSTLTNLNALPETARVLLIGPDALSVAESTSSRLAAWVSGGRRAIVLEQTHPLKYQGLPAEMNAELNEGRTAFIEDASHPVLAGLKDKDFFTWSSDEVVYRNAYEKPRSGAKSLVQCHRRLMNSALSEIPVGDGLMLVNQLLVGAKLATNAVAQTLLINLLDYAAQYRLEYRPVAAVVDPQSSFARALNQIGLSFKRTDQPLAALDFKANRLAIIEATPANLKSLADHQARVKAFLDAGGYLIFNGLTPEGLADYNKLVGFDHMIRPFGRERVSFPPQRHPLTAGLTTGDIVMRSGERIFGWTSDEFVASDVFSYVVDYTDVAPFARFEDDFKKLMVNGMVNADAWKYIVNLPVEQCKFRLELPKPQPIASLRWVGNLNYWPATQVTMVFDGKDPCLLDLKPNDEPQDLEITPPRTGQSIQINITRWQEIAGQRAISGLDNLFLYARRPPEFLATVKPLLNIGAMMFYQRGQGGIVLANLLFKENEAVPENALKKRAIIAAVLRNLKAPFAGGHRVIAGAKLNYQPIDLTKFCTQFRNERGWFGDAKFTFAGLPSGRQTFSGVPFNIFEFETSPVPNAIMLGGSGIPNNPPAEVKGIPINRQADALFFLHTARLDQRMDNNDRKQNKRYEMLRYRVTYADGQTVDIPILAEIDIDHYRQKEPPAIPGAQIAWTRAYEGTDQTAVAYLKQWNNPRPGVEIKSLDMTYGNDRRGVPVLLALTAATAD